VGVNGHIGFNEPAAALTAETHVADLADETWQRNFPQLAGGPAAASGRYRRAYTMGIGTILRARRVLLLGAGEAKREVLEQAFGGPITTQVPASLLRLHADVTLVLDEAAAGPALRR
jgi:glucosamine-6-phosphate deaminase